MTHELNCSSWSEISFQAPNCNHLTTKENYRHIPDLKCAWPACNSSNGVVSTFFIVTTSYCDVVGIVGKLSLTTYAAYQWTIDFSKTLIGFLFHAFSQILSTFKNVVFLTVDTSMSVGIEAHELSLYSFTFKSLVI